MWTDEVVEEVREVRRRHAEAHGNDLRRIYEHLKERERRSGRQVVHLPPRRPGLEPTADEGASPT